MALISARNPHDALIAFHGTECVSLIELPHRAPPGADLSHFIVGREFKWPITLLVQEQVESVLDRSLGFQGRAASREQIQLPISFEHHREWFALFVARWEYGFRSWKQRNPQDACLNFLRELGPRE
jgi:hypothetical protein